MKKTWPVLLVLLFLGASSAVQAQLEYTVNPDNTINITGYTGPPWTVSIPTNINGLTVTTIGESAFSQNYVTSVIIPNSVTTIGQEAFYQCLSLTSVTIGNGVTNMGSEAFVNCYGLTSVTISNGVTTIGDYAFAGCNRLNSVTIPGSVNSIGADAFFECTSLSAVTISNGVNSIGAVAFLGCTSLTNVTIPGSVASIQDSAFSGCTSLVSVFFTGNAPTADSTVFAGDTSNPVIYYLHGTTGWSSPFASRQALVWNPLIQASGANFGVSNNQFGFNITGTPYIPIVIEACTNLANAVWTPLLAVTLTNSLFYFSEPLQTNIFGRYYRISSP